MSETVSGNVLLPIHLPKADTKVTITHLSTDENDDTLLNIEFTHDPAFEPDLIKPEVEEQVLMMIEDYVSKDKAEDVLNYNHPV